MTEHHYAYAETTKTSLFVQVDLKSPSSHIAISAATDHRWAHLTEKFASTLARTICEFPMRCFEFPQNLQTVSDHDLALLRQWNKALPTGVTRCVHDLIIERARKQPRAPALSAWDGDLTYEDLDELSCQLASLLYKKGVRPNEIVALCFEKSKWTTVAMLGTLRAGGAFVLIDTAFPLQRATAMVKQVDTKLLLCSSSIPSKLKAQVPCSITVDNDLFRRLPPPCTFSCDATPLDLAVVLFTSGSTGTPKAILQDHIAASTTAHGLGQAWKLTSKSRILQFAAYAFDMSVIDTLKALVNGACLCVPRQEDMNDLGVVIEHMKINVSAVTTICGYHLPSWSGTDVTDLSAWRRESSKGSDRALDEEAHCFQCLWASRSLRVCSWSGTGHPSNVNRKAD